MEFTGITFAGKGQNLDTGAKVVHAAPDTSSYINTKSISKDGGISTFRSSVVVNKDAEGSKSSVSCESLMLDAQSQSDTIPAIDVRTRKADVGHEAQIGKISNEAIFYLMSRGLSEEDARACIVSGFADNVSKELPLGLPNTENEDLFEALRELRKRLADEEALPAYIVLSDKVLHLLSTSRPTTIEEFGNISGIGEYKKKKYGKEFVNLIRKFSD